MVVSSREYPELAELDPGLWPDYLEERSGLPGPRANLRLVAAAAFAAAPPAIEALLAHGGEYQVLCAAAALARGCDDPASEARARGLARDGRWRVREGVAIGLQLRGDESPSSLSGVVLGWVSDPDPLVRRAAVAAICEPRLLKDPALAATALEVCRRATRGLAALPEPDRRQPGLRTLRQALGYGWSVAVAALPAEGLAAFRSLDADDPDVAWIVRENSRKKRLAVLLG